MKCRDTKQPASAETESGSTTSNDLKSWQFAQLRASIAPKLRYFARLHDRMFKLGVGTDDPLLVAARDAHHAVFWLFTSLHTFECEAFKRERETEGKRRPGYGV